MSNFSQHTMDASLQAKMKIESQKEQRAQYLHDRENRRTILETYLSNSSMSDKEKDMLREQLNQKESEFMRLTRSKASVKDFDTVKVIGRGGFGEVRLVVKKGTNMIERKQIEHVRAERDILAQTHFTNEWVVKMYNSFQDDDYLYIVMEYLGGGDMMSLLIKEDIFPEEMARFYIAELVLALDSIHRLDYIHRDVKPDNILIGYDGHIKLTDFGLCTGFHRVDTSVTLRNLIERAQKEQIKVDLGMTTTQKMHDYKHRSRDVVYSVVGTPDYTAPEVFENDDAVQTCLKIVNYPESYRFPSRLNLSDEVQDLIRHLICPVSKRYNTVDQIKNHPFFNGFDFDHPILNKPPFIPKLSSMFDTSNFEDFETEYVDTQKRVKKEGDTKDLAFKSQEIGGVTLERIFTSHESSQR
ncbi:non-specific serine/threonine protein kinase [Entamoeba marina]